MRAPVALVALAAAAAAARAQPAPRAVSLTWEAPAGCPSSERILAETDRILAGSTVESDPPIEARARVTRDGERWLLSLETRRGDAAGSRALEGESCTAIGEAVIVILVLMIDPALIAEPRLEELPPPPPPPPPAPVVVSRPAPPPPEQRGCRWGRPAVGLSALGDLGALPAPAAGGRLSFGLRRCALGAEAGLHALSPRTGEAELDPGAGGDLWLLAGTAGVHLAVDLGRLELGAGGGLEVGAMSGRGVGIDRPETGRALWLAARAGGSLALPLTGRLAATLGLDLVVPLRRPRFVIDDLGAVHRPAALGARLALGLAVTL